MEKMINMMKAATDSNWQEFDKIYKELVEMAEFFEGRKRLDEKVCAVINAYCACASHEQFLGMVSWFHDHDFKLAEKLGLKI